MQRSATKLRGPSRRGRTVRRAACWFGLVGALLAVAAAAQAQSVTYHGVTLRVPAGWSVIRLDAHPATCVRFDRRVVYLGAPRAAQTCPAHAAGRSDTVLVEPSNTAADPAAGQGVVTLRRYGVRIIATWARSPSVVERMIGARLAVTPLRRAARRVSPRRRVATLDAFTGLGFDACSAPSRQTMQAWLGSPYRAVGVYIGGVNAACSQPNLTSSWVSSVTLSGWHLVPTYVGLQAPNACSGCAAISASPATAAAQGSAAAADAASRAAALGIAPGAAIYDDMEAYTRSAATTASVLAFLSAWTTELHAVGYLSGVYGSGASAITDLVNAAGSSFAEPDDVWIAHWNGLHTTSDAYVPASDWANHQRLHQYDGGHNETYGAATLNIDGDAVDGDTATAAPQPTPLDGSFVSYRGQAYLIVAGAPLPIRDWSVFGGPQPVTLLTSAEFAALAPYPSDGALLRTSQGALYRVVGGAPLYVTNPAAVGADPTAAVLVDAWDLTHTSNADAHLRSYPADGTLIRSSGGGVFEIVGGAPLYVSRWSALPTDRSVATLVDAWDLAYPRDARAHLRAAPADGVFIRDAATRRVYRIAGGAPFLVTRWSVFGHASPYVIVDGWNLTHFAAAASPARLLRAPRAGTVIEALPSRTFWVFRSGRRTRHAPVAGVVTIDQATLGSAARPYHPL